MTNSSCCGGNAGMSDKALSGRGDLVGKIALVTGGSRGIGRACCEALAARGATVLVNYTSNEAAAQEVVSSCVNKGGKAEAIKFNVAVSSEVDGAFERIQNSYGRVDILVNNAGISKDGLFIRYKDEDWRQTLGVNLDGVFYCSRAAAKMMLKSRWGRIVNVSSVVGEMGNAGQIAYSSSKAAVIGFTKALAKEVASRTITVNAVTPGFIETDMTHALTDARRDEVLSGIPLGRYGQASEVAALVEFLCSEQSAYITGQIIGINGGMYI